MVETVYFGYLTIHPWELLALPFYLLFIYVIARRVKARNIEKNPLYKYYIWGLFAKIAGGFFFVYIYLYVYNGGDTTAYFESSMAMRNLLATSPSSWLLNEFGANSPEHWSLFSVETGYPLRYMYFDSQTEMVIRLVNPLLIFTSSSYLLTTVLLDWLAYAGIWRLFLVFSDHYPNRSKLFALAILFFPSVIFWGSGILKDTVTFSCTGWVVYCIHRIYVLKKNRGRFYIPLLISLAIIFFIKPYVIFALLPGSLLWIFSNRIAAIRNSAVRLIIVPMIFVVSVGGGFYLLSFFGSYMGKFALEKIANTAIVTQNDLKKEYYHGHSFDIGLTDASPTGLITKFPAAFVAGIYRPFIWESGNVVMLISGLENTLILLLTISSIFQSNLVAFFRKLFREPILFFALSFSIFFAFSVGITTSNFGALVRFKISYLPFFLCALFILIKRQDENVEFSNMRSLSSVRGLKG